MERVKPLAQVLADGYMTVEDNTTGGFSGSIVHPKEGPGTYMAPLTPDEPKAFATRLHEYAHLNLITSEEQPIGLHSAFESAGIAEEFLQAMADAKVMSHCSRKGLSLKDLVVLEKMTPEIIPNIRATNAMRQANLFLRAIGTDSLDFVAKAVSLSPKQLLFIRDNIYPKIAKIKSVEDWVRVGLEYQRHFETPTVRSRRKLKGKEFLGTKDEPKEAKADDEKRPKKRATEKTEREDFKEIAKRISEIYKEKIEKEEGAARPKESMASPMEKGGGLAGGKAMEKGKPLDVFSKEAKEKSDLDKVVQEVMEFKETLDPDLAAKLPLTMKELRIACATKGKWGPLTIRHPKLERNFEPKERSKKLKRSFVGAFRYPHRLVSDHAVFGSKQRGKGGTLLIDCSGSMSISFEDIIQVLEQRPFATIAVYASSTGLSKGSLIILVDAGKRVTESVLKDEINTLGGGNVVDGPALDWLCKRSGEKFWICDGCVTGVGDGQVQNLDVYAALMTRRYHVKRWASLEKFTRGKQPNYG